MILIERSVGTLKSPSIAARSLAGPTSTRPSRRATSKRPRINYAQYLRIPSRILKVVLPEEVVNDEVWQNNVDLERMECRDIQISCMAAKSLAEPLSHLKFPNFRM
jgi:hypothetical protein